MNRAWSVELCSQFETGAGIQLRSPEPGVVTFLAPWDSSPEPMWFHFRIRGAKGWRVKFVLMNATRCLGGAKAYADRRVRPVVTEDPPRCAPSGRRWRRVREEDLGYDEATGRFSFTARIRSDEAYVAHCYPYGLAEWREFADSFKGCPWFAERVMGRTAQGRPIPQAKIGERSRKRVIWLTARHHSGETPGSWALEGTLRWLLSDDPRAQYLRRLYVFQVVPFADLDGVVDGYYGKERAPVDFNRAYLDDTPRPETECVLKALSAVGARNLVFLDYHAPGAGGSHQLHINVAPGRAQEVCKEFGRALVVASPARSRLGPKQIVDPTYMGDEKETTSTGAAHLAHRMLAMTCEVSYALTSDDRVLTRADYLRYGASIGRALHKVLQAHGDDIAAGRLVEAAGERQPFDDYAGAAFMGAFQWVPARDARLRVDEDAGGEVLHARLLKKDSSVHLACAQQTIGTRRTLRTAWRFAPKTKSATLRAQLTVFYYGPRGLRCRRDEKAVLQLDAASDWQTCTIRLRPPKAAHKLRASIRVQGGPGEFSMRPAVAR